MSSQKTRNFGTAGGAEEAAREDAAPAKTESLARGSSNMSIEPGVVLSGKYWIDRVLAHGGMGIVVAARHLQLDERVAIKFLRDEIVSDADAAARFAREARTAIKIKSEHVARVIDVDSLENGAPFMVMEYLEGEDLAAWIRSRGPLPLEQAVEFVLQACEAIAEAHGLGIVHRDLKPANLFVSRRADGIFAVKVLDFGISKVAMGAADDPGVTTKNAVIGIAFVHVARTACIVYRRRRAQRHLGPRRHAVRDVDRPDAFRRRYHPVALRQDPARPTSSVARIPS